ncbi:MAG TPA: DUF72 domain-containing protein [Anaerolineales bacterium]|nr:DUF72 domain-containing protein [Anaerolineales bacterium]
MDLWVGTSGYSYKEWKGIFYPSDLKEAEMLHYYAERLPAVEINNTFYRLPKSSMLEAWGEQVPPGFRFVLKASRRITHIKRLREAGDETSYLFDTAGVLGGRLGPVLFQLPPNFQKDLPRLQTFLAQIPPGKTAAVEFRHASWFEDDVFAALKTYGCALCQSDTDETPAEKVIPTTSWGYLRLRKEKYTKKQIQSWAEKVGAQDWRAAYVFFKDEGEGHGPKWAQQFLEAAGAR